MNNLNESSADITVYILRGIPGSGKDYLVEQMNGRYICSADKYYLRPDGYYEWTYQSLSRAHKWCYDSFCQYVLTAIWNPPCNIFVNNTNISYRDFSNYIAKAVENKCKIVLLEPNTTWKFDANECFKRNQHGVPLETIQRMILRWQSSEECAALIKADFGIDVNIQIGISNDSTRS